MKNLLLIVISIIFFMGCNESHQKKITTIENNANTIKYAEGLAINIYDNYTKVVVSNTFPGSTDDYTYILHKNEVKIPDSLSKYIAIEIPIKSIITTSTTHIPALEMLEEINSLKGFPNCDYISSIETRKLIDAGKVREIGNEQSLNTEVILDINPSIIMGYNVDSDSKIYSNLQKNGIKIVYNSDWTEKSPLGRAEWIKLFGALYDKNELAEQLFTTIEKDYEDAKQLAKSQKSQPSVFSGAIFKEQWFLPQGDSWAAQFFKDANCNYLWSDTKGTGSLSLSFETVLEKAKEADYWIGPGQHIAIDELLSSNSNYGFFKAVADKKVYSFSTKKGATGGIIYYELAFSRPDLVLKDLISILHPTALPEYELYFFEKLK